MVQAIDVKSLHAKIGELTDRLTSSTRASLPIELRYVVAPRAVQRLRTNATNFARVSATGGTQLNGLGQPPTKLIS